MNGSASGTPEPQEYTPGAARAIGLAVLAVALIRTLLALVGAFHLTPDEAYFWEWSRHLDWGFYDQGPAVAALIRIGTTIFGTTELGVRAPAIALSAATSHLLARLVMRMGGGTRAALLSVLALNVTPLGQVNGFIMTYYLPQVLLWTLVTHALLDLRAKPAVTRWLRLGLWLGLGGLTHHTFLCLALLALLWTLMVPTVRRAYSTAGPYLGAALAAALVCPYILWNARHDWVSARHALALVGTHAQGWKVLRWYAAGQFAVYTPLYFVGALVAMAAAARRALRSTGENDSAIARLVALGTWPLFLYVGILAWSGRSEANWTSSAAVLMAAAWSIRQESAWKRTGRLPWLATASLGLALLVTVAAQNVSLLWQLGLPRSNPSADPLHRLKGWQELGAKVFAARESLQVEGPTETVCVDDYAMPAELSFYARDHRMTWCPPIGRRHHQYDFWKLTPPPLGGNGVWVSQHPVTGEAPERKLFRQWSPPRRVDIIDSGTGVLRRSFYYHLCRDFTGQVHPNVQGY